MTRRRVRILRFCCWFRCYNPTHESSDTLFRSVSLTALWSQGHLSLPMKLSFYCLCFHLWNRDWQDFHDQKRKLNLRTHKFTFHLLFWFLHLIIQFSSFTFLIPWSGLPFISNLSHLLCNLDNFSLCCILLYLFCNVAWPLVGICGATG